MSKKQKKQEKSSDFHYVSRAVMPKRPKIKTAWALGKLYYRSERDPQIERDIVFAETAYASFAKKYRGKDFTSSAAKLRPALADLERLANMLELSKPARYFAFRHALNAADHVAEKKGTLIDHRMRKAGNEILFFSLTLGALDAKTQKLLTADPQLQKYRYYLERIFLEAKHNLTEAEEKILSIKSGPSYGMWVAATEKIIGKRTITYNKRQLPLNEAIEMIDSLPSGEKPGLWNLIMDEMVEIGEIAENEFTAILNDAKTDDELRSYPKPYSATILSYEDDEKSIEALLEAVRTKGFALSKSFYKAKAAYHKREKLHYAQKYDSIGVTEHIPFDSAVDICRDVFYGVNPAYGATFDTMLANGQIDVYPKQGKRGGAFMSCMVNLPTQVFLNHTDTFKSLETLAHEMGHAIHAERSKTQPVFYQDHSITTAETASTLFENLVFDAVYSEAREKDKIVLLHDRITRDIATIQRQIAFFNAELEMHNTVRTQGAITNAELAAVMQRNLQAYLGPAVEVSEKDGYSYVYVSHFRYGFYVYTYTFGILMSTIMANRYKEDRAYGKEIDTFLCAGKKDTVANIFKEIGIDTTKPDAFKAALGNLENDIEAFKKFTRTKN